MLAFVAVQTNLVNPASLFVFPTATIAPLQIVTAGESVNNGGGVTVTLTWLLGPTQRLAPVPTEAPTKKIVSLVSVPVVKVVPVASVALVVAFTYHEIVEPTVAVACNASVPVPQRVVLEILVIAGLLITNVS